MTGRRCRPVGPCCVLLGILAAVTAMAGVDNGNTLALDFATGNELLQKELAQEAVGKLYFFRYLDIAAIDKGGTNALRQIKMSTVEPSSDMKVEFVVRKSVSLKIAAPLKKHDAIAVTGRIKVISAKDKLIVLEPVVVRYKDAAAPKAGLQLLYEVDPKARRGTDTSSGEEKILK